LYADTNDARQAEAILVDAMGRSLGDAEPLIVLELARMLRGRGELAGAANLLVEFVDANPSERVPPAVAIELSQLLQERGDSEAAERVLRRAADREGAPAEVLVELGDAYSRRERPAGAADRQEPDLQVAVEDPFDLLASAAGDLPATKDLLGFGPLVRALYALLDDPNTTLPLAIAVTAPRGAGKSSVMRQLGDLLDGPVAPSAAGTPRRRWRTVRLGRGSTSAASGCGPRSSRRSTTSPSKRCRCARSSHSARGSSASARASGG
jgi:tetratricopeptide (TPR) repeat protein